MSRHIVLVAPPWYAVPPHGYGGIELVVALLAREFQALGHRVTLLAREGSGFNARCLARAVWAEDHGRASEQIRATTYAARVFAFLRSLPHVDVIHDHAGLDMLLAPGLIHVAPFVHTVHGALGEAVCTMYESVDRSCGLVAVSESQRRVGPRLNWVGTVHNAVDTQNLTVGTWASKDNYLLCLARISPTKGQHIAIEVARRAGKRLILAGAVSRRVEDAEYFEKLVAPAIDGNRVLHLNNIAGEEKARLLAQAAALVAPIQWEEPFGLALVEAMASGTPAIALARGSAPELITHGVTGFLVDTPDEMVEAIERVREIDPEKCSATTRRRFEPRRMAQEYLRVYNEQTAD